MTVHRRKKVDQGKTKTDAQRRNRVEVIRVAAERVALKARITELESVLGQVMTDIEGFIEMGGIDPLLPSTRREVAALKLLAPGATDDPLGPSDAVSADPHFDHAEAQSR